MTWCRMTIWKLGKCWLVVALPHEVVNLGNGSTMLGSEVVYVYVLIRRIIVR